MIPDRLRKFVGERFPNDAQAEADLEALFGWLRTTCGMGGTPTLFVEGVLDVSVLQRDPTRPFDLRAKPPDPQVLVRYVDTIVVEVDLQSKIALRSGRVSFRGSAPFLVDWGLSTRHSLLWKLPGLSYFWISPELWEDLAVGDRVEISSAEGGGQWRRRGA